MKAHTYLVVDTSGNKCYITNPHSKDLLFRAHSYAINSFIFTFMWKSKTFSNFEWCGGWNNGVMGSWTTWFLDFNKRGAWNKRGGAKFEPFLTNVVAEITELWVENSHKINCRDVTSIREGTVLFYEVFFISFSNLLRLILEKNKSSFQCFLSVLCFPTLI